MLTLQWTPFGATESPGVSESSTVTVIGANLAAGGPHDLQHHAVEAMETHEIRGEDGAIVERVSIDRGDDVVGPDAGRGHRGAGVDLGDQRALRRRIL